MDHSYCCNLRTHLKGNHQIKHREIESPVPRHSKFANRRSKVIDCFLTNEVTPCVFVKTKWLSIIKIYDGGNKAQTAQWFQGLCFICSAANNSIIVCETYKETVLTLRNCYSRFKPFPFCVIQLKAE